MWVHRVVEIVPALYWEEPPLRYERRPVLQIPIHQACA